MGPRTPPRVPRNLCTYDKPDGDHRGSSRRDQPGYAVDRFGAPAAKTTYRVGPNAQAILDFGLERATEAVAAAGASRVERVPLIAPAGFHLLGTARMGSDPETSVVNADCAAHDVPNLMVIDGSVFVTAAALNPTSTIQAIALRAADRLIADRHNRETA